MRTKSTGGFTLIELLIVIAIIGILAAVLIPNLLSARTRAFDTAAQSCARSIATAQEVNFIDNNSYAADLTTLNTNTNDMAGNCVELGSDGNPISNQPISVTSDGGYGTEDDDTGWVVYHTNGRMQYTVTPGGLTEQVRSD